MLKNIYNRIINGYTIHVVLCIMCMWVGYILITDPESVGKTFIILLGVECILQGVLHFLEFLIKYKERKQQ